MGDDSRAGSCLVWLWSGVGVDSPATETTAADLAFFWVIEAGPSSWCQLTSPNGSRGECEWAVWGACWGPKHKNQLRSQLTLCTTANPMPSQATHLSHTQHVVQKAHCARIIVPVKNSSNCSPSALGAVSPHTHFTRHAQRPLTAPYPLSSNREAAAAVAIVLRVSAGAPHPQTQITVEVVVCRCRSCPPNSDGSCVADIHTPNK